MSYSLSHERSLRALHERIAFDRWAIDQGWDISRRSSGGQGYWNRRTAAAWAGWLARAIPTSLYKEHTS